MAQTRDKELIMAQMDESAAEARNDFNQNVKGKSQAELISWMNKWYLKAGYKRISHIAMNNGIY